MSTWPPSLHGGFGEICRRAETLRRCPVVRLVHRIGGAPPSWIGSRVLAAAPFASTRRERHRATLFESRLILLRGPNWNIR